MNSTEVYSEGMVARRTNFSDAGIRAVEGSG